MQGLADGYFIIPYTLGNYLANFSSFSFQEDAFKEVEACVPRESDYKNQELEKAGRVGDFLELAELMARDALMREESCGCHFRTEYQSEENEARRNDADFSHVSLWKWQPKEWEFLKEKLTFERVKPSIQSYYK